MGFGVIIKRIGRLANTGLVSSMIGLPLGLAFVQAISFKIVFLMLFSSEETTVMVEGNVGLVSILSQIGAHR